MGIDTYKRVAYLKTWILVLQLKSAAHMLQNLIIEQFRFDYLLSTLRQTSCCFYQLWALFCVPELLKSHAALTVVLANRQDPARASRQEHQNQREVEGREQTAHAINARASNPVG